MVLYSQMNGFFLRNENLVFTKDVDEVVFLLTTNDLVLLCVLFSAFFSSKGKDLVMLTIG